MLNLVLLECPECGQRMYGYSEEEVEDKYEVHKCKTKLLDDKLWDEIEEIINGSSCG